MGPLDGRRRRRRPRVAPPRVVGYFITEWTCTLCGRLFELDAPGAWTALKEHLDAELAAIPLVSAPPGDLPPWVQPVEPAPADPPLSWKVPTTFHAVVLSVERARRGGKSDALMDAAVVACTRAPGRAQLVVKRSRPTLRRLR